MRIMKTVVAGACAGMVLALTHGATWAATPADITSHQGITIGSGGKSAMWGGAINLTQADSFAQSNGKCAFNVSYDMENTGGTAAAKPFKNRLLAAGAVVSEQSMLTMQPGEMKQISTQMYLPPGSYALQLSLDADNNVIESNKSNNNVAIKLTLDSNCSGEKPKPPAQPDIVSQKGLTIGGKSAAWGGSINLSRADSFAQDGGKCAFNVAYDVENIGTAVAGPAFANRLYSDADVVSQQTGLSLNAGESKTINTQAYLTPGVHAVRLVVDADNNVVESNEANNVTTMKVVLDADCKPAATQPPSSTGGGTVGTGGTGGTGGKAPSPVTGGGVSVAPPKPQLTLPNGAGLFTYKVPLSATIKAVGDGAPYAGIAVHFKIDNLDIGSANTDSSGVAHIDFLVPETLPTGANKFTATADVSNGMVNLPITATANFDAVKAPTSLTFSLPLPASKTVEEEDTITMSGHLHSNSPDKTPLAKRKITFYLNGKVAQYATTDANGNYTKDLIVPKGTATDDVFVAQFEGDDHYLSAPAPAGVSVKIKHKPKLPPATITSQGIHIIGIY